MNESLYIENPIDFILTESEIKNLKKGTELVWFKNPKENWSSHTFIKQLNEKTVLVADICNRFIENEIHTEELILRSKFKYKSEGSCYFCWYCDWRNEKCFQNHEETHSTQKRIVGDKRGLTPYPPAPVCYKHNGNMVHR